MIAYFLGYALVRDAGMVGIISRCRDGMQIANFPAGDGTAQLICDELNQAAHAAAALTRKESAMKKPMKPAKPAKAKKY